MLDHDPVLSAKYLGDLQLKVSIEDAVTCMAQAWHDLYSDWSQPPFEDHKPLGSVTRIVPYSSHPKPAAGSEPKMLKGDGKIAPGGAPVWLLMGQRIPGPLAKDYVHPCVSWVQELGGNYDWTWRFAMATLDEYIFRADWPVPTVLARAVHTLEVIPPPLRATKGDWSEAPVGGPNLYRVQVGGFYDTVASNRLRCAADPNHSYGPGPEPYWLDDAIDEVKELTTPQEV